MRAIFFYIPVIHKQVLDFLKENEGTPVWLLDNVAYANENVYLERDARALPAEEIKKELAAHGIEDVTVVSSSNISDLLKDVDTFVVTDDEIVLEFIEKYAKEVSLEKVNIFIRWTQKLSTTEFEVTKGRKISKDDFDKEILKELEKEAEKSSDWWRQIASAVVRDGKIVAKAHNEHGPSPNVLAINGDPRSNLDAGQGPGIYTSIHSEASVIAKCAREGISTKDADIYVSTFPCPTCARSIAEAGFKRLFYKKGYSLLDAEEILGTAGIEIILVED